MMMEKENIRFNVYWLCMVPKVFGIIGRPCPFYQIYLARLGTALNQFEEEEDHRGGLLIDNYDVGYSNFTLLRRLVQGSATTTLSGEYHQRVDTVRMSITIHADEWVCSWKNKIFHNMNWSIIFVFP